MSCFKAICYFFATPLAAIFNETNIGKDIFDVHPRKGFYVLYSWAFCRWCSDDSYMGIENILDALSKKEQRSCLQSCLYVLYFFM